MAGWLHGVFVGDWLFVFPLCGFSLSLFCNYYQSMRKIVKSDCTTCPRVVLNSTSRCASTTLMR